MTRGEGGASSIGSLATSLISDDGTQVSRRIVADPEIFEHEVPRIFGRCWQYVGHESEIPEVGDFTTAYLGPQPVVVTRGRDRAIHVLLNTCSHRAARVCRVDRGHADRFTCSNHGWSYGLDGSLVGVPRRREGYGPDASGLRGLEPAAQVDTYYGLIFATLDPSAPSLRRYLGEATFYLDTVFDHGAGGTELIGGVHRWLIPCNWKLPPENQAPDLYHAESAHASIYEATGADAGAYMSDLTQVVTDAGHTLCVRRLPTRWPTEIELSEVAESEAERRDILEFFADARRDAQARLGPLRGNLETIAGTVFPNFSFISNIFNIRLSLPRGHDQIEMRSWCIVPAAAPTTVKAAMRKMYATSFGPGGMVEADDCENWASMTAASRSELSHRVPFFLGLGAGREFTDPELPGRLAGVWSEHSMRGYWQTWARWMQDEPW